MIRKAIISVFLSLVILFSGVFTPVAHASLVGDVVIDYSESSWASQVLSFILSGAGAYVAGPYGAVAGIILSEEITSLADWYAAGHTDQEVYDAYNTYVTDLQSDLGSTTLIDGGVRIFYTPSDVEYNINYSISVVHSLSSNFSAHWRQINTVYSSFKFVFEDSVVLPFDCTYQAGFIASCTNVTAQSDQMLSSGSGKKGYGILLSSNTPKIVLAPTSYDVDCAVSGFAYLDVYPLSGASLPTTHDITINSLPQSRTGQA